MLSRIAPTLFAGSVLLVVLWSSNSAVADRRYSSLVDECPLQLILPPMALSGLQVMVAVTCLLLPDDVRRARQFSLKRHSLFLATYWVACFHAGIAARTYYDWVSVSVVQTGLFLILTAIEVFEFQQKGEPQ